MMNEKMHTPGPWSFMPEGRITHAAIKGPRSAVAIIKNRISTEDGLLIAAAPDLLGQHEANLADLWLLRGAIQAGDSDREILMRVAAIERRTEAALARATQGAPTNGK